MRLGFVGAGRMGRPMVRRLIEAGHEVRVLGRSAGARAAIEAEGARAVTEIGDVGTAVEAVLICVFDDEQIREVCFESGLLGRIPGGSTIVVHTTGSPDTAASIAARARPAGIDVLDAPVSGGPHDVAAGRVTLFVGGSDDAVARVRPVLGCYGDPVLHVGPPGSGQRVKLVNNALFAAQIGLLSDAIGLATRLGLDEAVLLDALSHGSAASRALSGVEGAGSVARFAERAGDFIRKDVAVARKVAAEFGGDLGALESAINALPHKTSDVRPAPTLPCR